MKPNIDDTKNNLKTMTEKILVTGGVGYIGSHTCLMLLDAGYQVVVVDNLSNSSIESLKSVEMLSGKKIPFYKANILNSSKLEDIFKEHNIKGVIHFAGLKSVAESSEIPLDYYEQNIYGTLSLLKVMKKFQCFRMVFSSSATVYGEPESVPITEDFPTTATNAYGRTKLFIEEIMRDLYHSDAQWKIVLLRYFNPVGAHKSGLIGESPRGIPNNLMPFISQVAAGKISKLSIFGDDYLTHDGTGIRDYIHIMDLSDAHVKAIQKIDSLSGVSTLNLGRGKGYSVMQMVKMFEMENDVAIPYQIVPRRPGDISECWADCSLAKKTLGWQAKRGLAEMMRDTWGFVKKTTEC